MARIVLGLATSHSPMLGSPAEDYLLHADRDRHNKRHLTRDGRTTTYAQLEAGADATIAQALVPQVIAANVEACQSAISRLADTLAAAEPDVVIVVGDDQKEQFLEDNLPAMLIYGGDGIENGVSPLPETAPAYWKRARSQFHEAAAPRTYPTDAAIARHLTRSLIADGFDVSYSERLPRPAGEGHAYGFVHRRLMRDFVAPVVPVVLNTYYPPNQPRPVRCFGLGRAIAGAVEAWPADIRVACIASGGLSHFTVDETLDRRVMEGFMSGDGDSLGSIPSAQLNSGNSEIRNWITVAGATVHLAPHWHTYVPCYRTPAGTGCGMGFAVLQ